MPCKDPLCSAVPGEFSSDWVCGAFASNPSESRGNRVELLSYERWANPGGGLTCTEERLDAKGQGLNR